ncbi:MAG: SDR family oxidoreductase [Armatimonadota bacterium]
MAAAVLHVVTGAFGYSGRYIARLLLDQGKPVRTLTGHPDRPHPFGGRVQAVPYSFDDPAALTESLRGADTLFNTYWIRFERGPVTYEGAVANTRILFRAAAEAGVRRVVHVSVTNPSEDSPLPYFRGKALVERALMESGLSYAIVRPPVLFGKEDILINNIAWLLRMLPVFGVFGAGDYRLQPVYVGDMAARAVELAASSENVVVDTVGTETYTFLELVRLIRSYVGSRARLIHVSPRVALAAGWLLGRLVRDVIITREEIEGLMANLLVSDAAPTCPTRFSEWGRKHGGTLGTQYASELARHFR